MEGEAADDQYEAAMREAYGDDFSPYSEPSVSDVLPPEYAIDYMAWELSSRTNSFGHSEGNAYEYLRLMNERNIVELTEAYAMKRVQMYLTDAAKNNT